MRLLSASFSDVTSNARFKLYPATAVFQVSNYPIFHCPGYEPRKRSYDVSPKGEALDEERSKASSRARAKASVRDIALCNRFDWFFTWTLSKDAVNRYDAELVGKKVRTFLRNASFRKNFSYVCVPELHKDGGIHFHGLCNLGDVAVSRAVSPYTSDPLFTKTGQPIYNMTDWKFGFSTCIPIDENYERTVNYLVKYISKDATKVLGKWYLSSRNLVKHPDIKLVDGGVDFYDFHDKNPALPVISLYRDVCMISVMAPEEVCAG